MKVLLVNGSSRKKGCTNAALCEVERALQEAGIGTEQFFIGNEALPDCVACRKCRETGRCVFHDSVVGVGRLELPASCSQSRRATNCATPRYAVLARMSACQRGGYGAYTRNPS